VKTAEHGGFWWQQSAYYAASHWVWQTGCVLSHVSRPACLPVSRSDAANQVVVTMDAEAGPNGADPPEPNPLKRLMKSASRAILYGTSVDVHKVGTGRLVVCAALGSLSAVCCDVHPQWVTVEQCTGCPPPLIIRAQFNQVLQ
jgi:hypothetical protein